MTNYFIYVNRTDNGLNGKGCCYLNSDNIKSIPVSESIFNNITKEDEFKYIYDDNSKAIILRHNTEELIKERNKARVNTLSMTPLDFIKALEKFAGITYAQVKELCDTYPEIDRELRFCQNVYRNNPMFSQEALAKLPEAFRLTDEQIDNLFIAVDNLKNGNA